MRRRRETPWSSGLVDRVRRRWIKLRWIGGVVLLAVMNSCAGPQPLGVAIDPHDETTYLQFANEAKLNGRTAFAHWMAVERNLSPEEVLRRDARISSTHNPFDANHDRQAVSRGAVVYKIHCLRCHGADARGHGPATLENYPANDFQSLAQRFAATVHRGAPRKWFRVIRDGKGDLVDYPDGPMTAMPSFADKLAREQIWQVITYLQSLTVYAANNRLDGRP